MKKFVLTVILGLAMALGALVLAGCSESYLTIGDESDDALSMVFTNSTGKTITGVAVKATGDDSATYSDNMMGEDAWEADAKAKIYCAALDASGTTSDGAEVELKSAYDVQITFEDGTTATLHGVTFEEADEVELCLDEESGLGYLKYTQDGSEATTLEAEKATKQAEEEAAAAAAAEAEAAAQAQAEAEAAAEAQSSKSYSYNSSSSSSSSSSGSSSSQSEDSCIDPDDVVLR